MEFVWGLVLWVIGLIILAQVIRWAVRKGIQDASESLRADFRAVLDEMQRRRRRENLDNQRES
jgi:hypothetical protein